MDGTLHRVANVKTERSAWIDAGLDVLAEAGPDAVTVEGLARRLGVTKGGFYGHFANRQALLDAMLDTWEQDATRAVVDRVHAEHLEPGPSAFRAAELTWADGRLSRVDLAVRDWARRDPDAAERLRRVDTYRLDYLRTQMNALCPDPREAEARSLLAYAAAIGMRYSGIPAAELGAGRQDAIDLITAPGSLRPVTDPDRGR
jgi:AcrR family transcriptional regulator